MVKHRSLPSLIFWLGLSLLLAATAEAQTPPSPPAPASASQTAPDSDDLNKAKTQRAPRVSKFEARRIRHVCRERADERGVKGADREAYLSRCFFGRRITRKERRDCAKLAAAQGGDKAAQRDFLTKCLRDRRVPVRPGE
jgi:hypothetical protein